MKAVRSTVPLAFKVPPFAHSTPSTLSLRIFSNKVGILREFLAHAHPVKGGPGVGHRKDLTLLERRLGAKLGKLIEGLPILRDGLDHVPESIGPQEPGPGVVRSHRHSRRHSRCQTRRHSIRLRHHGRPRGCGDGS